MSGSGIIIVPPQQQHCEKCGRDVEVAVNPGKPGIETDCKEEDCQIAKNPDNQASGSDGTLIVFPEEDK